MPENTIKKIISDNISTAVHAILHDKHLLEIIGTYLTVGLRANMAQQWKGQTFFISYNKRYKKNEAIDCKYLPFIFLKAIDDKLWKLREKFLRKKHKRREETGKPLLFSSLLFSSLLFFYFSAF